MKNLWIGLLLWLNITTANADFHLMETKDVYLDGMYFTHASQPWLAPTYRPSLQLDLHLDVEFLNGWVFWDNMIHSQTDANQYRLIGWNYRFGVHLGPQVDVYFDHFSQHPLDYVPNMPNSYDAVGVRVYFYRRDKK